MADVADPHPEPERATAGSKTLDNGIRVLKALAQHPRGLTMTELATAVGAHRTVVYRLLGTLTRHGLVAQGPDNRYQLGLAIIELSGAVRPDLQTLAQAPLRELADETGATAFLSLLDGDEVVSTLVVEPLHADAHVAYRLGTRHPVTLGSAGLAILSARAPRANERGEISLARERGYSVSQGEIQRGAWGLAAPIRPRSGDAEASVGVVALQPLDEVHVARLVMDTAETIGKLIP
ncbi:IclR family transcriptional regulator [Phytoactinopolyspora limicola]|uniref:IclR family transcriptional regulator n=1 Tax=Phytoactinopolyspora limicola TaxID=2715536 RepID=UPI00140D0087|nr:IclR family transcriptional regulator [Phytoactinopolyspora limicola]